MTNYVTGYLPTVPPKDWMKIAVGGVLGAVQLKDLKDYVGQANNGNTTTIKLSDVTIPSDSVIYKDAPTSSNIQLNFSPLGANEDVTVTDVSNPTALNDISYDKATRLITTTGQYAGRNATIRVTWSGGTKDFTIPVQLYQSGNGGGNTQVLHPDLVLNPSPQTLTSSEFDTNGLAFTSREDGSYGGGEVTAISGQNLSDFTIDYGVQTSSTTTIKPNKTGLITNTQDVVVTVKKDDEVRQVTFHVTGEQTKDVWTFSPDTATVSASDFAKTGVQTWARDDSGSGEVITWSQLDGNSMSNFTINANQTSSGQQTIILKDASTVSSGNVLVFHAIGGGTEKTFTVTIS